MAESRGIDVLRPNDTSILVYATLLDGANAKIVSGTASLRIWHIVPTDGTIETYDFNDDTFKSTAITTNTTTLTHRTAENGGYNTGVWTYRHTTLTDFDEGDKYILEISHASLPAVIQDVFQYGGGVEANIVSIDGQDTDGNNATLNLKQLNVVNSAGSAIVASSTGSNGHGIAASGNGSGEGISGTGGATGSGIAGVGGSSSGDGMSLSATQGYGLRSAAGGSGQQNGARFSGANTGRGVLIDCPSGTGVGLGIDGGSTSGDGVQIQTTSGFGIRVISRGSGKHAVTLQPQSDADALNLVGAGSGAGFSATGGATGAGAIASAGSGNDWQGTPLGSIPSAASVADAVWDEARAGHVAAGSFGEGVASVQGDVTGNVDGAVATCTTNTDMRGTDSAALASVCTEARLAELDAANVPADIDSIVTTLAGLNDPTANAIADALLDRTDGVETSYTPRQALRIILSVLAGKSSGHSSGSPVYRDVNDSTDRVTATATADGRSAVTLDAT